MSAKIKMSAIAKMKRQKSICRQRGAADPRAAADSFDFDSFESAANPQMLRSPITIHQVELSIKLEIFNSEKKFFHQKQSFSACSPSLESKRRAPRPLRDAPKKKKRENVGILKKQGGGSTRIPLPFFTVFYMGDPPKKGPKMQNKP